MKRVIREDSELNRRICEVEDLMHKYGIQIDGAYMKLSVNGQTYNIGRDSCEFPRQIDEPFWRDDDSV